MGSIPWHNHVLAEVVKLVDTGDSKSPAQKVCEFKSRLRHQFLAVVGTNLTRCTVVAQKQNILYTHKCSFLLYFLDETITYAT